MTKGDTGFIKDVLVTGKHKDVRERKSELSCLQYVFESVGFNTRNCYNVFLVFFPQDNCYTGVKLLRSGEFLVLLCFFSVVLPFGSRFFRD